MDYDKETEDITELQKRLPLKIKINSAHDKIFAHNNHNSYNNVIYQ